MNNKNEYAFAMLDPNGGYNQYGMTIRDYFAAAALQGLVAHYGLKHEESNYAKKAYELADDMLNIR